VWWRLSRSRPWRWGWRLSRVLALRAPRALARAHVAVQARAGSRSASRRRVAFAILSGCARRSRRAAHLPTAFGLVVNHPSFGPRGTRIKSAGGKECQQPLLVVFRGLVDAVAAVAAAAPRSMGWCGCVGWIDSRPTKRATPRRASPPSALDQWGSSYKGSIARPINLSIGPRPSSLSHH
jgi:hypothetical protein